MRVLKEVARALHQLLLAEIRLVRDMMRDPNRNRFR